jgi:hypothetical protein
MNVHTTLKKAYNGFSIELHKNANVNDTVQLAIFIHGITMDFIICICKELAALMLIKVIVTHANACS